MKQSRNRRRTAANGESRQLNEADILRAALALIRRDGSDKFSMRVLATELGVTPMAIYHYVPSKAALVEKLGDSLLDGIQTPTPTGVGWAEEYKAFALDGWRRMSAHPNLGDLLVKQRPTLAQRQFLRYGASILLAAGFDARNVGLAMTTYNMFMYGVMTTQAQLSRTIKARKTRKGDRIERYLDALDFDELIEYELDILIAGLRAQLQAAPRPARVAKRLADRASKSS